MILVNLMLAVVCALALIGGGMQKAAFMLQNASKPT